MEPEMSEAEFLIAVALDGRTIRISNRETLVLLGINVPSIFASSSRNELWLGLRARTRLQVLLDKAQNFQITRSPADGDGRIPVSITADDADLATILIEEGYGTEPGQAPFWL